MKICGLCLSLTGGIAFLVGICFPFAISYAMIEVAKEKSILQKENESIWRGIPGKLDIEANRLSYVYNCTNKDDVREVHKTKI